MTEELRAICSPPDNHKPTSLILDVLCKKNKESIKKESTMTSRQSTW